MLVFRFRKLEYSRSGHSYVSLGMTLVAHNAFALTQLYFTVDRARRKAVSAVAHLCLMPSTYAGVPWRGRNGCKIYLGQSYNVSTPCSLSQQFSGLRVPELNLFLGLCFSTYSTNPGFQGNNDNKGKKKGVLSRKRTKELQRVAFHFGGILLNTRDLRTSRLSSVTQENWPEMHFYERASKWKGPG